MIRVPFFATMLAAMGCGGLVASTASPDASLPADGGDAAGDPRIFADAGGDTLGSLPDGSGPLPDVSEPLPDVFPQDVAAGPLTCADLHAAEPQLPSGTYAVLWRGQPAMAYCEMETAGGGFTAFFAGSIGAVHVFAHFENPSDDCVDPAIHCLRHPAPDLPTSALFMGTCGDAKITFQVDAATLAYFSSGIQDRWRPLIGVSAASPGARVDYATQVWTGEGTNTGFILSVDDNEPSYTPHTFLSSYDWNALWDYCNGVPDTTSMVRLLVR